MKKLHDRESDRQRVAFERALTRSGLPHDEAIEWLAERTAVHPQTVRKYLSGQKAGEKLLTLVEALGTMSADSGGTETTLSSPLARQADHVLRHGSIEQVRLLTSVITTLHKQLQAADEPRPIVFTSAHENVPMLGSIAAGIPAAARQQAEQYVAVPADRAAGVDFALRVAGDSMVEAGLHHGDIVLCARRDPESGEIVAAMIDGECTLKRYFVQGQGKRKKCWLEAANPRYPRIEAREELQIQGVMVGKL